MRRALVLAVVMSSPLLVAACGDDDGGGGNDPGTTAANNQLANPSAVYCVDSGGTYNLDDGTCALPDGQVVDGWDYFYEQNPASSTSG